MLVACRLAGLSALEGHYAGLNARPQLGRREAPDALKALIPRLRGWKAAHKPLDGVRAAVQALPAGSPRR
jgi:hypothetical protein